MQIDDRVKLPSDPTRTVKGVDVLPFVLSPLMGPEEYDIDVSRSRANVLGASPLTVDAGDGQIACNATVFGCREEAGARHRFADDVCRDPTPSVYE